MSGEESLNWDIKSEVQEANLNYLILAQKMIKIDKSAAMYRLGISDAIADLISTFSSLQLVKLASSSVMLMNFRFEDASILEIISQSRKPFELASIHSAILLSSQSPAAIT